MRATALLALGVSFAPAARAETHFLPGHARELSLESSASRDAPVVEYAYGPRAYGSLGAAPGILAIQGEKSTLRFGFSALVAWENDSPSSVLPKSLLWRDVETISAALALPRAAGSTFEFALAVGHEGAHRDPGASVDTWRAFDIPFGASGWFVAPDVALALPLGRHLRMVSRLGDRIFFNAFPRMIGQRRESDYVADYLNEGLSQAPFAELDFRWRAFRSAEPLLSLYGEALLPHDDSARDGVLARALLGLALPGEAGELVPMTSFEAGNGKGYFVNRRELRFSMGVRFAFGRGGSP